MAKSKEVEDLVRHKLPVHAGRIAKDHFQDNFRKGGFVDRELKAWKPARRLSRGSKAAADNYPTLLSARKHLFNSIRYTPGDSKVVIINDVPYAAIHNYGYRGVQYVKPHKRNRLEAMSLKTRKRVHVGGSNVRGFSRRVNMPQRQFMGESAVLGEMISAKIEAEINKILKS